MQKSPWWWQCNVSSVLPPPPGIFVLTSTSASPETSWHETSLTKNTERRDYLWCIAYRLVCIQFVLFIKNCGCSIGSFDANTGQVLTACTVWFYSGPLFPLMFWPLFIPSVLFFFFCSFGYYPSGACWNHLVVLVSFLSSLILCWTWSNDEIWLYFAQTVFSVLLCDFVFALEKIWLYVFVLFLKPFFGATPFPFGICVGNVYKY